MQLSDLQSLVATLCNDTNNSRYLLSDINTELDNTQGQWNAEIKIIRQTSSQMLTLDKRQYDLILLTGLTQTAPIAFPRVTHKGIDLKKRSKSYFDLYTSSDWTQSIGTPTSFFIEATDAVHLELTVFPTPQSGDLDGPLVVEAVMAHTPMTLSSDVPFLYGPFSNYLLRPYDFYLAYSAAARLLARDPNLQNNARRVEYMEIAEEGKDLLITVFKELEADEPRRMTGGRNWGQ